MHFMKSILSEINEYARRDPAGLIAESDRNYRKSIREIARHIADDDNIKIVAVAGPSGSGKTTTAHILCEALKEMQEIIAVASLDDFYLPADRLPILSDGSQDLESVAALDTALIRERFTSYLNTGVLQLPKYEFATQRQIPVAQTLQLGERGIVIVEGLHAMNPEITDLVPREIIYKIYISTNQKIRDDEGNVLLDGRRQRLVRRVLRDEIFRDADVNETLCMWENVIRGEEKFLYCFKDTADVRLKTLHFYEPGVFRNRFLKSAEGLAENTPCREYFLQTVEAVRQFVPIAAELVPENSLIREFIGEGKYR